MNGPNTGDGREEESFREEEEGVRGSSEWVEHDGKDFRLCPHGDERYHPLQVVLIVCIGG